MPLPTDFVADEFFDDAFLRSMLFETGDTAKGMLAKKLSTILSPTEFVISYSETLTPEWKFKVFVKVPDGPPRVMDLVFTNTAPSYNE